MDAAQLQHGIAMKAPILALDFDETIAARDTTDDIVRLAAASRPPKEARALLDLWGRSVREYRHERRRIIQAALDAVPREGPLEARVKRFYAELDAYERSAVDAVEKAGILAGIRRSALKEAGRRTPTREGAREMAERWRRNGGRAVVVSANWSEDLAREGSGIDDVRSNTLEFDRFGVSTGRIHRRVVSAMDKRACVQQMRASGGRVVYVGDALNDLPALLEADIGFLIGGKEETRRVWESLAIPVQYVERVDPHAPASDRLYVCLSERPFE